jgi:uncharacterized Tic20 family protein
MPDDPSPSKQERTAAALAHAGALTVPVLIPLVIWRRERKQSAYVGFQARQALAYQAVMVILVIIILASFLAVGLSHFLSPVFLAGCSLAMVLTLVIVAMTVLAYVAIFRVDQGQDFRYPLIGKWLDQK